jgi:hypothetical protein
MNGKPAQQTKRERFPAVRERIGEDPARYLDYPEDPDQLRLAYARIRGIDRQSVIVEWLRVERELERGPRETVIGWLQERNRELIEHGDRDDQLETAVDHEATLPSVSCDVEYLDHPDGERPTSAADKIRSRTFATDGGDGR